MNKQRIALGTALTLIGGLASAWVALAQTGQPAPAASACQAARVAVDVVPGMPPVADPTNLYRETGANQFSPAVAGALERVYVPNRAANTVSVIDPATLKVDRHLQGRHPPAARGAVLGPAHLVGGQQRRRPHRRQPDADRPARPASRARRSRSTTRTTCTGRPTASTPSWWPRPTSGSTSATCATMELKFSIDTPGVRRHQPCRLLDRRPLCVVHLRIQRLDHQDRPGQPQGAGHDQAQPVFQPARRAGADRSAGQEAAQDPRPGPARQRDLHHARHAAGRACLTRRQDLLRGRHDGRRRARGRRRQSSSRSASSRPVSARTACTRAATARACTWPTAAATRSAASRCGKGSVSVSGRGRRSRVRARVEPPLGAETEEVIDAALGDDVFGGVEGAWRPRRAR